MLRFPVKGTRRNIWHKLELYDGIYKFNNKKNVENFACKHCDVQ